MRTPTFLLLLAWLPLAASAETPDAGTKPDAGAGAAGFPVAADGTPMVLASGDSNPAYYNPPKNYRSSEGFQKARWGMTKAEVKKSFPKAKTVRDELAVADKVAGLRAQIAFGFAGDRLAVVYVTLAPSGLEPDDFESDFDTVEEALTSKYGKPAHSSDEWSNDLFRDSSSQYATALALGHVVPTRTWQTGETEIELSTDVGTLRRTLTVWYRSRRLEDAWAAEVKKAQAESKKDAADDL